LWRAIEPIYAEIVRLPFLRGLIDGTLPMDAFRFYIIQDALYLRDYARCLGLAAARAPRSEVSARVAGQPEAARSHESAWTRWTDVPASAGRRHERWRVVTDGGGRLVGAVRMVVGRNAVWLNVAGSPEAVDVGAVFALALAEAGRLRPGGAVWTAVGDREPAIGAAATAAGFVPVVRRQRCVRQTGLQRIAPSWRETNRAVPQVSARAITHAQPRASRARERAHSLPEEGT